MWAESRNLWTLNSAVRIETTGLYRFTLLLGKPSSQSSYSLIFSVLCTHVDNSAETFEQPHNVRYKRQTRLNAQINSNIQQYITPILNVSINKKLNHLYLESGSLPMSHDLKGPAGGKGLIHRTLCFCFIIHRSVGLQLIAVLPNFFLMKERLSNVSYPEESPPMKTVTWARGLLQHCQLADRNFRDISSLHKTTVCSVYKHHSSYKSELKAATWISYLSCHREADQKQRTWNRDIFNCHYWYEVSANTILMQYTHTHTHTQNTRNCRHNKLRSLKLLHCVADCSCVKIKRSVSNLRWYSRQRHEQTASYVFVLKCCIFCLDGSRWSAC